MKPEVPNKQEAIIDRRKLFEYLLSPNHPLGRNKARVFSRCGYDLSNADELIAELKRIITEGKLVDVVESIYGSKYIVDGTLRCSRGSAVGIRTVWIVETDSRILWYTN